MVIKGHSMSTHHRPTAHEPPLAPPPERVRPISPELPNATEETVPAPADVPAVPVPDPGEEPI